MIHAPISIRLVAGQKGNISSPKDHTAHAPRKPPTPGHCGNTYFQLGLSRSSDLPSSPPIHLLDPTLPISTYIRW